MLNASEYLCIFLSGFGCSLAAVALVEHNWAVITDTDGTVADVGLVGAYVTWNGTTIDMNISTQAAFAGSVAFITVICALSMTGVALFNVFLVGAGARNRDRGHQLAFKAFLLGGAGLVLAAGLYYFLYPSNFDYSNPATNTFSVTLNDSRALNFTSVTYSWTLKSVDHLGSSFSNVIVGAQLVLGSAIALYFAYSRIKFE